MNTIREACDYVRRISPFRATVTSPAMSRHESGGCAYEIHVTCPHGTDFQDLVDKTSHFCSVIGRTGQTLMLRSIIPNDFQP
jgi:hypothetical protein